MKQLQATGIILRRTDYGEADRIVMLLTPEYGKLSLMAKGVRRVKSKLAGGIELFSTSQITFLPGRGDVGTLVSTRLVKHFGHIVENLERTMLGYDLIKRLNSNTEDNAEADYFNLLQAGFAALDDPGIDAILIGLWFEAQLLRLAGHTPNLRIDTAGQKLRADAAYNFDFDAMSFAEHSAGASGAADIKFLRLLFSELEPAVLNKISGAPALAQKALPLVQTMANEHLLR